MEDRTLNIASKTAGGIKLRVIPGHFMTSHSHTNCYIDTTPQTMNHKEAMKVAQYFANLYSNSIVIDTIVCLDGTEVIGAYLAELLSSVGVRSISEENNICIITPETNINGQMMFRDNVQGTVYNKKLLILAATGSTGKSVDQCIDTLNYYGGWVTGIATLFSGVDMIKDLKVESIFHADDIPGGYHTYNSKEECPLCQEGRKIDALVNAHGYSKI